jgi:predicted signal transduction protein with EAL and GGDEF domain
LRASDTLARYGGDEFAVLLPAGRGEQAARVARALLEAVRSARAPDSQWRLAFSIGIATVTQGPTQTTNLLERADAALYMAKQRGGNDYAIDDADPGSRLGAAQRSPRTADASGHADRRAGLRLLPQRTASELRIDLKTMLQTVAELGAANESLVAWEQYVDELAVAAAWSTAVRSGLVERTYQDPSDGQWMYELTARGRSRMQTLEADADRDPGAAPPTRTHGDRSDPGSP